MAESEVFGAIIAATVSGVGSYAAAYAVELRKHHSKLRTLALDHDAELCRIRKEYEEFRSGVTWVSYCDHAILLDGVSLAGKSALIARWMDPTLDFSRIVMRASAAPRDYAIQFCSQIHVENGRKNEIRHRVKFGDVPGEDYSGFADSLSEVPPKAVIMFVDPTNLRESQERFSLQMISYLYTPAKIRTTLAGVIVLISKADAANHEQLSAARKYVEDVLLPLLRSKVARNVRLVVASTFTGNGFFELQLAVSELLDVKEHFKRVKHDDSN